MSQESDAIGMANIEYVESQLTSDCDTILCPYCKFKNFKVSRTLCCDTLRKAIIAILSGRRALVIAAAHEKAEQN